MKKFDFDRLVPRKGTDCVKWDLVRERFGAEAQLPMWVADMDFAVPPCVSEAVQKRAAHPVYGYTFRPDSWFEAVQGWLKRRYSWEVKKEWILFSPGIVPAVNLAVLAYTQPGDKVIVQPPVYFPFFSAVRDNGRELVYNPLKEENEKYSFDFDNLRSLIDSKTRMLIISNPHNPVGRAWNAEELTELASLCAGNGLILVSDEIHSDLTIPPYEHTITATLGEQIAANTITMMAPSKTFNLAGLATSQVIIPDKRLRDQFQIMVDRVHVGNGNLFGMVASRAAYIDGDAWLDALRLYLKKSLDRMEEFFTDELPEVRMIRPEATYLVWLDFRSLGLKDEELDRLVREKAKLALVPGRMFGPGGEGFQRMNIATSTEVVMQALGQLAHAIRSL
ncbi:MAG: pyridoxal phosphate-dependent aminotransferase [Bacteroidales bacterium]